MKQYIAEMFGTFALVFAGTGAIVINDVSGGLVSHVGIALTFGLIVMVMIRAMGDISGAHINPVVTLGFWIAYRLPNRKVLPYILSQCLGAVAGSLMMRALFVNHLTLGGTLPSGSVLQSFALEVILTFLLMFVILCVSTGGKEKGIMTGAAVGAVVGLEALFAGPISGASMNPARSFGPALVTGYMDSLWIYFLAPVIGSYLAVLGCRCIQEPGCCCSSQSPKEELG